MHILKDLNKVIISGKVVNTPTLRMAGSKPVTNFSLKSSYDNMVYHKIIAWDSVAEDAVKTIKQDDQITVDGEIIYRTKKDITEIEIKAYRIIRSE